MRLTAEPSEQVMDISRPVAPDSALEQASLFAEVGR